VDRLVERMDLSAILAHELGPLAARRWRELGRRLPEPLLQEERAARFIPRLAVPILARVREAYPGRILILKGPEIAALYPPGGRLFVDLDLLVDDARAAQQALVAAGFAEIADTEGHYAVHHHLIPLSWPGVQLKIEIHSTLNWPRHLQPPPNAQLFDQAIESRVPVDGLEAPAPAHHAVLMVAHCWKHVPLGSVRDLVDVTVLAEVADRNEVERTAELWGVARIWHTTAATSTWLLEGGKPPFATRLWARNLLRPREATILERHARRWVTPFWMLPPRRAIPAAARNIAADIRPVDDETWRAKLRRILRVAANPSRTRSEQHWQRRDDDDWS
jgi:putative nucleotidyltransferase-like protein